MSSLSSDDSEDARQPNLVRDVSAIGLVAATLFLTVAIATRSPADPIEPLVWPLNAIYTPDQVVYPTNDSVMNACGYWGALISSGLFDTLGLASALVVGAAGGIAMALLVRGHVHAPVLRSLGGTIIILGTATAAGMIPLRIVGMPVVGNGGYLGAMTSIWLLEHLRRLGPGF